MNHQNDILGDIFHNDTLVFLYLDYYTNSVFSYYCDYY